MLLIPLPALHGMSLQKKYSGKRQHSTLLLRKLRWRRVLLPNFLVRPYGQNIQHFSRPSFRHCVRGKRHLKTICDTMFLRSSSRAVIGAAALAAVFSIGFTVKDGAA